MQVFPISDRSKLFGVEKDPESQIWNASLMESLCMSFFRWDCWRFSRWLLTLSFKEMSKCLQWTLESCLTRSKFHSCDDHLPRWTVGLVSQAPPFGRWGCNPSTWACNQFQLDVHLFGRFPSMQKFCAPTTLSPESRSEGHLWQPLVITAEEITFSAIDRHGSRVFHSK